MPSRDSLENPSYELSSIIYTEDGEVLGQYYTTNREWVDFADINPHLVNALVATEDERYFSHTGIDVKGTARAFAFLGKRGGASTITQQLAKQFYTPKPGNALKRIWQKMKEWVIAIQFEKRYTKGEIIAMLLNKYDFIYDSNGISAAAKTYFGKDQKNLSLHEAAVLIGMFKNPDLYNPVKRPENAKKRMQTVLKQMYRNEYIDKTTYDELKDSSIDMSRFNRPTHYTGNAPYLRGEMKKFIDEILDDPRNRKPDGTKYNKYQDGLRIYTAINMEMQRHAETAAKKHMAALQDRYWDRWKGKDPWSYRLDEKEKDQAQDQIRNLIRQTERYQSMRSAMLSDVTDAIVAKVPSARLLDHDVMRMVAVGKQERTWKQYTRDRIITEDQAATYRKVMKLPEWSAFVEAYGQFQKQVRTAFNTNRSMKVFDHATGEKTVQMSPLDSLKYHHQHMQIGSISIDPKTGHVKTWIGGINYKYFQFDHVQSHRQVGSTFKSFVYATAVVNGISPCYRIKDQQYVISRGDSGFSLSETWAPGNASGFSGKWMNLYEGLKTSTNSISVALMKEIGNVEPVRDLANNFGLPKHQIPAFPSIALGTPELSVMEMTAAYAAFANNGTYIEPVVITRIEDKDGKVIYNAIPEVRKAIPEKYNYAMLDLLQNAASILKNKGVKSQVAGKTGTTNDHIDGWFMGVTPDLVVGTWVGGDSRYIRFNRLDDGQGSVMARPMFEYLIKSLEQEGLVDTTKRFEIPEGDLLVLDCSAYDQLSAQDTLPKLIEVKDDAFDEAF